MAHDIFICHAHQDNTVANAVCATLEAHGIRCWIAPRDILPGSDWGEAIIDAIQGAKALVLVFSSNSNESDQVKREVERAVHQGIAVVPFRIEDILPNKTLEYFISTQHWLDALTPPLEDHLHHLAETITVLLAKKEHKEKPGPPGFEPPAPSHPQSPPGVKSPEDIPPAILVGAPPRKFPWALVFLLVGFLLAAVVAGGVWRRWSQPVAVTKAVTKEVPPPKPSAAPPVAESPAKLSATEYYNLGNGTKDPEEKIKYFTQAIEINPYNAQYYYYRGLAYKAKARFPLAIEDFSKAITYQANYPNAYVSRGLSHYEMGQQDAAIADYTQAISLDSSDAATFFRRAVSFQKKGENEKALADYQEAIRLHPKYVSALNNRGLIYLRTRQYEKALADFNEALRLNPKYVLGYKNRAVVYERMGDKDRAAADRNQAKSLDPKGLVHGF
jgi:regulator of sirC expression with transglutaminase-like and TPR domain